MLRKQKRKPKRTPDRTSKPRGGVFGKKRADFPRDANGNFDTVVRWRLQKKGQDLKDQELVDNLCRKGGGVRIKRDMLLRIPQNKANVAYFYFFKNQVNAQLKRILHNGN